VGEDLRSEGIVGVQDRERAAARLGQRRTARQTGGTGGSARGGQHDSIGSHERPDLQEVREVFSIQDGRSVTLWGSAERFCLPRP
jgi:hypothetical protein